MFRVIVNDRPIEGGYAGSVSFWLIAISASHFLSESSFSNKDMASYFIAFYCQQKLACNNYA